MEAGSLCFAFERVADPSLLPFPPAPEGAVGRLARCSHVSGGGLRFRRPMPATPSPPGARRRRRRESKDWVALAPRGRTKPPPLPRKSPAWLPSTRAWWSCLWRSPMSAMYLEADLGGLHRLAYLHDASARGELPPSAHAAITALEDRYGLSPKSRQSLQWLVVESAPALVERPRSSASNVRRLRAVDVSRRATGRPS